MSRFLPYPLLTASLLVMWILLNGLTPGHVLLGAFVACGASLAVTALQPSRLRLRRWWLLPRLAAIVLFDITRSNIAVASIVMRVSRRKITSGFVTIPLRLRDPAALALLSCIITSTPGTAWVEYRAAEGKLLLHVLDLVDEEEWVDLIQNRYERLLLEIFE